MPDKLIIGCGYLGQRVASRWLAQGHRVFATTRRRADALKELGVVPIVCDVLDRASLVRLPHAETVLHCVGMDRSAAASMNQVFVGGVFNVSTALKGRETRFLYVGSTGVYGQGDGGEVDESSATDPAEDSGRIVLEAEQLLLRERPDAVRLRFAGIYGPGRLLREKAILAGETLTADGEVWLNLIHVEDGAAAVLAAEARSQPGGVYNVGDGHPVRRRDFYAKLAELLGAPAPKFVAPATPDRANRRISNHRLREQLSFSPRFPSFAEGLAAAVSNTSAKHQ